MCRSNNVFTSILRPTALSVDESFFSFHDASTTQSGLQLPFLEPPPEPLSPRRRASSVASVSSQAKPKSSVPAAIFNLSNTTLGAGLLCLPFFFKETGLIFGNAVLFTIAALSTLSLHLLLILKRLHHCESYMEVARAAYGESGRKVVLVTMMLLTFGAVTAYMLIIGSLSSETIVQLLEEYGVQFDRQALYLQSNALTGCFLLLSFPLYMLRNMSKLAFTSMLSMCAIAWFVALVVQDTVRSALRGDNKSPALFQVGPRLFFMIPTVGLAFTNHPNIFDIVTELRKPTPSKERFVVNCTTAICVCFYSLVGMMGYWRWGEMLEPDALKNYKFRHSRIDTVLFASGRLGMAFCFILSCPLVIFPCRVCFHALLKESAIARWMPKLGQSEGQWYNFCETVLIAGSAYTLSVVLPGLDTVFGLTGAISGSLLVYILPAAFFLKLHPRGLLWGCAAGLLAIGVVLGIASTIIIIYQIATHQDSNAHWDPANHTNHTNHTNGTW